MLFLVKQDFRSIIPNKMMKRCQQLNTLLFSWISLPVIVLKYIQNIDYRIDGPQYQAHISTLRLIVEISQGGW